MIHPDDPNPFAQFIVDRTKINVVPLKLIAAAFCLVVLLIMVLL